MGNKIIRISKETHSAFKDLCIREKKGITEGAEIIISRTLKQGTLLDVKKNVFSQIQGLENTFRSWMKQQEKIHLRGIQEDLLILTGRLKDVATRTETEEVFKIGINQLCSISENSLQKYEELLHQHLLRKARFIKHLKHILITSLAAVGIYFFTMLIFNFVKTIRLTKLDEIKKEYFALREYCRLVDENKKENVNILSSFDEEWEKHTKSTLTPIKMYIKVINPAVHGNATFSNTGSCKNLVDYLSKENEKLPLDEKELFFNNSDKQLSSNAVIKMIDTNIKGIAKGRTRFNSLVIAPDAEELKHIKHDSEALKKYTCEVMNEYAKNFKLKDGKTLDINDLVWAAKLEKERNGDMKNGDNMHIHVIVSARDKAQKISLSPNVNNKQRFNRVQFCLKSEKAFDKMFNYDRVESLLQTDQIRKYGNLGEKEKYLSTIAQKRAEHQPSQPQTINTNTIQRIVGNLNVGDSTNVYEEPKYNKYKKRKKKRRPRMG